MIVNIVKDDLKENCNCIEDYVVGHCEEHEDNQSTIDHHTYSSIDE